MVTTDFLMYMCGRKKNVGYVTELKIFEAACSVQEQCIIVGM